MRLIVPARGPLVRALVLGLVLCASAGAGVRAWVAGAVEPPAAGWVALAGWAAYALWCLAELRAAPHPDTGPRRAVRPLLLGATATAAGLVVTWEPSLAAATVPLLFAAVLAAAARGPVLAGVAVLTAGVLAVACGNLLVGSAGSDWWQVVIWTATTITFHVIGLTLRSTRIQHRQAQLLLDQSEQMQTERQKAAALDERARIAREIHDVLAHSLGALAVQLETVDALLEADPPRTERAAELVRGARRIAVEGLTETRRAITALRADTAPLADAVRALVDGVRERHTGEVRAEVTGQVRTLPQDVSLCLLRVAQEALTNAAEHAPGQEIDVTLAYEPARVRLTVRSAPPAPAGAPVRPRDSGGYGLAGMRERLRLVGGTLSAGPGPEGWTVRAEVDA
ncbi:histidine kinase [Streptomyces sp. NPDC094032]|uniref:sensor histidine kinase n=1 Tax=Streptomyces sp. NPDC094032 TaxID=3155308 RepID=UPI00331F303E